MNKTLKFILLGLAAILIIVVAGAGYMLVKFDPNSYKPQIIQAVKDKQNRTLTLDGNIRLIFFPSLGVKIENISLSEYRSTNVSPNFRSSASM